MIITEGIFLCIRREQGMGLNPHLVLIIRFINRFTAAEDVLLSLELHTGLIFQWRKS